LDDGVKQTRLLVTIDACDTTDIVRKLQIVTVAYLRANVAPRRAAR
jgi:hypothetical protein